MTLYAVRQRIDEDNFAFYDFDYQVEGFTDCVDDVEYMSYLTPIKELAKRIAKKHGAEVVVYELVNLSDVNASV